MSGWRIAVVSCIILIAILGLIYWLLEIKLIGPPSPKYSLILDGNTTYINGNISIVVGYNGNSSSKVVSIYGLGSKNASTTIFSSLLASQTGKVISNLTIGKDSTYIIQKDNNFPIRIKDVKANGLQSGVYRGFLYLKNDRLTTVPILISTEPKTVQAIILVVIGVLSSILFWEVFFFLNLEMNDRTAVTLTGIADALNNRIHANTLPPGLTAAAANTKIGELRQKAQRRRTRAIDVQNRYLTNTTKIVSAEVGTVVFGILTGIVGLANNNYVTNLVEINGIESVVLFGIGLGIGSLKGLIDR